MKKYVIVVASGVGKRMNASMPKQFLLLKGKPVLLHTLENIYMASKEYHIILVLNAMYMNYWEEVKHKYNIDIPHKIVEGGKERFFSVKNAMASIEDKEALVAIHDGVRPMVTREMMEECFLLAEKQGSAVCCVDSTDSVRIIDDKKESQSIDRQKIKLVQTPQCFYLSVLRRAYLQEYKESFTDDASVVENLGERIFLCKGERHNIKITTPLDLIIAERLL
ncbi:MAG: 2-C-methyl-D-erythritol 4-phosphate cytidylyltransferase [Bacteroidota bacterium]|nr:2-C-methyl-D-erythritol 4-phosphate cytidylyltransferase [Bacteroidota bacterium]